MLIEFKVGNYLSFKEEQTFSLVASKLKDKRVDDDTVIFNPLKSEKLRLLKSAVVFGANASGKSNFIQAIQFFRNFIANSSKGTQVEEAIDVMNYKLSTETENDPSTFEVIFLWKQIQYRYGFAVTTKKVEAEWLYTKELKPKAKETEIFFREEDKYTTLHEKFAIGKDIVQKQMVRSNALLLSVSAQFNEPISTEIFHWLSSLNAISGLRDERYTAYTLSKLSDPLYRQRIIDFTKYADLGIDDIQVVQGTIKDVEPGDNTPETAEVLKKVLVGKQINVNSLFSFHKKFDANFKERESVQFIFDKSESHGTKKYFSLAGPILDTLDNGKILVIDELDSKLHPLLTQKIISLFNSVETNPHNAQLIFTAHDTNLLSVHLFRRDQIWFTQKDRYGATNVYSLSEYAVRNDASFEKDYLSGKYGAVPSFKNFKKLFPTNLSKING